MLRRDHVPPPAVSPFPTSAIILLARGWQEAQADPAGFFRARGVEIPEILDMALQSHESTRPWPPMAEDLELVTVRCWWVWGKQDPDGDYLPPARFCLEVPQALLSYLHR